MIHNFHQVDKGVYRGSAPSVEDVILLRRKFGINKIISLDKEAGDRIDKATKLLGMQHIMLPIELNNRGSLLRFLSHDISKLLLQNKPTYIHCIHGKDRTGLAIALFRIEHDGWSWQKALKEAKSFGFGIGVDPFTVDLYERIIQKAPQSNEDNNEAYDIVSNQREYPSDYQDYTLDGWEQISWAPYQDYRVREYPFSTVDQDWEDQYATRRDYGLSDSLYTDVGEIPQSGIYNNATNGINGAGPSMVGSGIAP